MSKHKFVDGPINVVRLEGKINNIKKVFTIFFDIHNKGKSCTDINSKHIKKYLVDCFKRSKDSDVKYDFLFEIRPEYTNFEYHTEPSYIHEIETLFQHLFNYNIKKDKVEISSVFKNVRFHYMDIRASLRSVSSNVKRLFTEIQELFSSDKYNRVRDRDKYINSLRTYKKFYEYLYRLLMGKRKITTKIKNVGKQTNNIEQNILIIGKYINKIVNLYKNKNVKSTIIKLIKANLEPFSQDIYTVFDNMIKIIEKYDETKLNYHSLNQYNILVDSTFLLNEFIMLSNMYNTIELHYFSYMTDIYYLRRVLDKDYITNIISYTGAFHSTNYMLTLIKYFNFKVTHVATPFVYDNNKLSINDINNFDKLKYIKEDNWINIVNSIADNPIMNHDVQCVDLASFPKCFGMDNK